MNEQMNEQEEIITEKPIRSADQIMKELISQALWETVSPQLARMEAKIEQIEQIQSRQDQELLLMSEAVGQVGTVLTTLGDRQKSLNEALSNLAQRQKTLNAGLSKIANADISLNEILKDLGQQLNEVATNISKGNEIGQQADKSLNETLKDLATSINLLISELKEDWTKKFHP